MPKSILKRKNKEGSCPRRYEDILQSHSKKNTCGAGVKTNRAREWNRELRDRPCIYGNLIYNESGTKNQWEKHGLFSRWYWEKQLTI